MKRFLFSLAALLCIAGSALAQIPTLKPVRDLDENIIPAEKKGKWGYANANGKMIIKAVFDYAEPFRAVTSSDGVTMELARIKVGSGWGYITREAIYLIEPVYDEITNFDAFSTVVAESGPFKTLIGVRSTTSPRLGIPVLASNLLQMNLAELGEFTEEGLAWASKSGKWGLLNSQGNWVIPCEYSCEEAGAGLLLLSKDDKYGLAGYDGSILLPVENDGVFFKPELNAFEVSRNGLRGVIKPDGTPILDIVYGDIIFYPGLLVVENDGLRSAYSPDGTQIIGFGPWTADAYELLSLGYDSVVWDDELVAFRTSKDGKEGMLWADGSFALDTEYDSIERQPYGYLLSKDGLNAALSEDMMFIVGWGDWTVDLASLREAFDMVAWDSEYGFMVGRDGKYGVLSGDGALLIPVKYDSLRWNYDDKCFEASLEDGSVIYFDAAGAEILPESVPAEPAETKSAI